MADKKLTIQVDAKVSPAVVQMGKLLDDLAARGNKVAKSFMGVAAGGPEQQKSFAQGALAKSLLAETKLFDGLGKSGERVAKVLTQQVSKAQADLTKQLGAATTNLDLLLKKHEAAAARVARLRAGGAPSKIVDMFQGVVDSSGAEVADATAQQQQTSNALKALMTPQNMGAMAELAKRAMAVAGPLLLGAGVMMAGQRVAQGVIDWNMSGHAAAAGIGQATSAMSGATGSIAQAYALSRAMADPDRSYNKAAAMTGSFAGSFMKQAQIWNALLDPGEYFAGFRNDVVEGRMTQAALNVDSTRMQQELERRPMFVEAIGAKQAAAGRQVAAMRSLQLTGSYNQTPGQLQLMYEQFGRGAHTANMSPAETEAFLAQVAGQAGTGSLSGLLGTQRGFAVNRALRGGMSRDVVASLTAAGMVGGGDLLQRGANLDLNAQNALGRMVSSAVLDPMSAIGRSGVGGEGLQGMLAFGLAGSDPAQQARMLAQNAAGAGAMAKIGQGNDAYQSSKNLYNAIGVLGSGANIYSQDALSRLMSDPAAVAAMLSANGGKGAVTPEMAARGISIEQVREMSEKQFGDVASRYRTAGKQTKGGEVLQKLAGMTRAQRRAYLLANPNDAIAAGTAAYDADQSAFANEREAEGWIRADAGLGTKAAKGTRKDMADKTAEQAALDAQVDNIVTRFEKLGGATAEIEKALLGAAANIAAAWGVQMANGAADEPVRWGATAPSNTAKGPTSPGQRLLNQQAPSVTAGASHSSPATPGASHSSPVGGGTGQSHR